MSAIPEIGKNPITNNPVKFASRSKSNRFKKFAIAKRRIKARTRCCLNFSFLLVKIVTINPPINPNNRLLAKPIKTFKKFREEVVVT